MSLYLAIDAGGTRTRCLLADDHTVRARASTGTVKLMRVSEEVATRRLLTMVQQVAAAAGVDLERITRTCFGLAGLSTPAARTWARQILPAMVPGEFLLCGDEEIALDAAFGSGAGILVIAGTGSNIVGRSVGGVRFSAGGWGPVLGDEGSGYWIGLEALRAALRQCDRGEAGALLAGIQAHWELGSLGELVALANHQPAPDFAALTPVVAQAAEAGDSLSAEILAAAGRELARQVELVARKMLAAGYRADDSLGVAFTGSVLEHVGAVRKAMTEALARSLPQVEVRQEAVDPLDGALYRARYRTS